MYFTMNLNIYICMSVVSDLTDFHENLELWDFQYLTLNLLESKRNQQLYYEN